MLDLINLLKISLKASEAWHGRVLPSPRRRVAVKPFGSLVPTRDNQIRLMVMMESFEDRRSKTGRISLSLN